LFTLTARAAVTVRRVTLLSALLATMSIYCLSNAMQYMDRI